MDSIGQKLKKLINKKDTKGLITFGDNFLRKQIFSRVHKINKNFNNILDVIKLKKIEYNYLMKNNISAFFFLH